MEKHYLSCETHENYLETINLLYYYQFNIRNLSKYDSKIPNIFVIDTEEMTATFRHKVPKNLDITPIGLYAFEDEFLIQESAVCNSN